MMEFDMACESACMCYPNNWFGYQLAQLCFFVGNYGWCGMAAIRIYDSGQLWLYFSIVIWLILVFVETIAKTFFPQLRPCQCYHLCISITDMGMPCPEVLNTIGLFCYLIVFDALFGYDKLARSKNLWFLVLSVSVSVGMWWTGNYTIEQVLAGVIIGSIVGSCTALFFFYQFKNTIPLLLENSLLPRLSKWLPFWLSWLVPQFHDEIMWVSIYSHNSTKVTTSTTKTTTTTTTTTTTNEVPDVDSVFCSKKSNSTNHKELYSSDTNNNLLSYGPQSIVSPSQSTPGVTTITTPTSGINSRTTTNNYEICPPI